MKNIHHSHLPLFLMLLFLGISMLLRAQDPDPCEITCSEEMPVCSESPVTLSVPNDYLRTYRWSPGGATTNSITVKPWETTQYSVVVMDTAGVEICRNSITVEVLPRYQTKMTQLRLTCSNSEVDNGRTAQVRAVATGGEEPYSYYWEERLTTRWKELSPLHISPNEPNVAIGLMAYKCYRVTVTDNRGCVQRDSIWTRGYPTPVIEITCDPGDTLYIQKPDATFSFENKSSDSINIDHFFWTFEHDLTSTLPEPVFTYVETGTFQPQLTVYDDFGCDTVYVKNIYVNPVKLKIPSAFTPNGDGINDTFVIRLDGGSDTPGGDTRGSMDAGNEKPLNTYYKSTELVVFNRWGRIVYQSKDYQNDWDGGGLSDGTYFYVLKCRGLKEEIQYQGAVMIITARRE